MSGRSLASLLLLGLGACGNAPEAELVDRFAGEWRWVGTRGGITGETRTNPSHRWRLRFDRSGVVQEDYEGRPRASGRFDVERVGPSEPGAELLLELRGADLVMLHDQPFVATLLADTLLLASASSGFSYRFVRVEGP